MKISGMPPSITKQDKDPKGIIGGGKMNIALIGCGYVSEQHLRAWHKIDGVRVIAVCDLNKQLAKKAATTWNIHYYYTDLTEMLHRHSVSILDICTPVQTHMPLAIQAMEFGCHVLIEKPMTLTLKEADEIMLCQRACGLKVGVIHNWLFDPLVQKALNIVRNGHLGQILGVDIQYLSTKEDRMLTTRNHWSHMIPGGIFGDALPHPIYLLQAFLGRMAVKGVFATKVGDYPSIPFDELHAILSAGNLFGTIYISFNWPRHAIYMTIHGSDSTLTLELFNKAFIIEKSSHPTGFNRAIGNSRLAYQLLRSTAQAVFNYFISRKWRESHEACIRLFAESVLKDKEPPVSLEKAYDVVRLSDIICQGIEKLRS